MADCKIEHGKRYVILVKTGGPREVTELRNLLARFLDSPEIPYLMLSGQHYEIVLPEELSGKIVYIQED